MRLIDVDALPKGRVEWEDIENAPTVDAEPVRHGHWNHLGVLEAYDIAGQKVFAEKRECSMCHFKTNFIEGYGLYNYCPNCGAKMDEEAVT